MILKIKDIRIDQKLSPREEVNNSVVEQYAKDIKNGNNFPEIFIGFYEGKNYLIDGRHRLEAHSLLGEQHINCEVKKNFPDFDSMFLASIKSNLKHGLRLTKQDRLKVVRKMVAMKFDVDDISNLMNVALTTVKKVRFGVVSHILIKDKLKSGQIPKIIREKVNSKDIMIMGKKEVQILEDKNKGEFQEYELTEILKYVTDEEFELEYKTVSNLIRRIKKTLHKRYPKL